jgi:hypothetical protein
MEPFFQKENGSVVDNLKGSFESDIPAMPIIYCFIPDMSILMAPR